MDSTRLFNSSCQRDVIITAADAQLIQKFVDAILPYFNDSGYIATFTSLSQQLERLKRKHSQLFITGDTAELLSGFIGAMLTHLDGPGLDGLADLKQKLDDSIWEKLPLCA